MTATPKDLQDECGHITKHWDQTLGGGFRRWCSTCNWHEAPKPAQSDLQDEVGRLEESLRQLCAYNEMVLKGFRQKEREVGRLRKALEDIRDEDVTGGVTKGTYMYFSLLSKAQKNIAIEALEIQTPPESADETQPQTKDIMARTSATNRRLQELGLQKSHAKAAPQACECNNEPKENK